MPNQTAHVRTTTDKTYDYDQFRILDTNRVLNERHVQAIKSSFEDFGDFTEARPILVNERLEVIDGQHRLEAAKQLHVPVHFTVVPGLRIAEARQMNIMQRNWSPADYLESYAVEGREPYIKLRELHEEFPQVTITTLFHFLGYGSKGVQAVFRRGDLADFDLEVARERLGKLADLIQLNDVFARRVVAEAVAKAVQNENYDHTRMVTKVMQLNPEIQAYQGVTNNLRQLEDIYNHRLSPENRIRF